MLNELYVKMEETLNVYGLMNSDYILKISYRYIELFSNTYYHTHVLGIEFFRRKWDACFYLYFIVIGSVVGFLCCCGCIGCVLGHSNDSRDDDDTNNANDGRNANGINNLNNAIIIVSTNGDNSNTDSEFISV